VVSERTQGGRNQEKISNLPGEEISKNNGYAVKKQEGTSNEPGKKEEGGGISEATVRK
jgi:hypothetical protein